MEDEILQIAFKNFADDIDATVSMENKGVVSIGNCSEYETEIDGREIVFSVCYNRNFDLDIPIEKTDKFSKWLDLSVGNLIVQVKNTYRVSNLKDGDVIELKDKWHYVPPTSKEAFFKCLPSVYYLGAAECNEAEIESVSATAMNEESYNKFYKKFLILMNLSGYFRIIKYNKQLKSKKRSASQQQLTKAFKQIYELSVDERTYQFQPIRVIFDRVVDIILTKIVMPKKLKLKIKQKIDAIKTFIFED